MISTIMIYCGIIIMIFNVWRYIMFARRLRNHGNWETEERIIRIPILLLILFLIGYILVAVFERSDLIISAILFGGSVFVAIMLILIERIAKRIRENERLEARAVAAEEASEAKTFFLSNMSHDIRTPLNAILGYTTLAKNAPPDEQQEYIGKIEKAGDQMLTLVNEVLEMSRIESGKLDLEPVNTDLEEAVLHAGDMIRTQMEEKKVRFTVSCEVTNRWVLCDRNRFIRVVLNMLSNACKFTEPGGEVSLTLCQKSSGGDSAEYEVCVRDTGIGMSPEFLEHIFTPFERERTSTVSRTQGTGLGMSICKSIIDQMGGRIVVNSVQGEGSVFTVTVSFPLGTAEEKSAEEGKKKTSFNGMRLLLAEDSEVNREIATVMLNQAGFAVESASNGKEALEKVRDSAPGYYQGILMDIQMPVMDGYTAAKEIRGLPDPVQSGLPIIAVTANAFAEDRQKALEAGMNGHLAKPYDFPAMMKVLEELL